jgi:hypothetical protein
MTRPGLACPDRVASWPLDGREQSGGERGEEDRERLDRQQAKIAAEAVGPSQVVTEGGQGLLDAQGQGEQPERGDQGLPQPPGSRSPSRAPTDAPAAMAARLSRVPSPRTDVVVLRLVRRAGREHPPTYEAAWIGARANPAQTHQANRAAKPRAVMDDADGGRRGPRARPGPGLRRTLRDHWGLDWSAEAVDLGGSSSLNLLVGEADLRFVVRVHRPHVTPGAAGRDPPDPTSAAGRGRALRPSGADPARCAMGGLGGPAGRGGGVRGPRRGHGLLGTP